jgi:hypothetical protein
VEIRANATGVFWLEARKLYFGSHNQLDLPDADQSTGRIGIVDAFFPMSSGGTVTNQRSPRGTYDKVEISFEGKRYLDNVVRYNPGGPNYRIYYQGATAQGEPFSAIGKTLRLEQKIHVWLRLGDDTLELMLLDRSDAIMAALRAVSVAPAGWHERTSGANGRSYGVIDLTKLAASGSPSHSADEDAEWMVWRYAILPQLIDTATQVGATELIAKETRNAWLEAANASEAADRWTKFDEFLASLSLAIAEEGYGLTRGLTVVDIPAGAAAEYVTPETQDEPDEVEDNGDADSEQ